ncbi:MAG: hypothetical protein IH934_05100 [Nanoarchaeota archaeon]|nr:hypothetical protein [Nanoarchaeota archaeon]
MVNWKEVAQISIIAGKAGRKSCPVCGCKKDYKNVLLHCAKFGCSRHWIFHKGNKE